MLNKFFSFLKNIIKQNFGSNIHPEDTSFISDIKQSVLNKTSPLANLFLVSFCVLVIILLIWSYFGTIEQMTTAEGKVIPVSQVKMIQNQDSGVIKELLVHEGDMVKKDQIVAKLDTTRYQADYEERNAQYLALQAITARLKAEAYDEPQILFPKALLQQDPDLAARETRLFQTRRESLQKQLEVLENSYRIGEKQLKAMEEGVTKGYISKLEYLNLQLSNNDAKNRWLTRKAQFEESAWTELNQRKAQLASITETLISLRDKILHSNLTSSVNGIVKKINVTTIGEVIQAGSNIMEIVPVEDYLVIQAKIMPSDIAFVQVGQEASVKLSAYDYSIYGDLRGTVERISADTIKEARPSSYADNIPYYMVTIRTKENYLLYHDRKLPILPGMSGIVQIKTGKKTILQYILKPLIKAKQEGLTEK